MTKTRNLPILAALFGFLMLSLPQSVSATEGEMLRFTVADIQVEWTDVIAVTHASFTVRNDGLDGEMVTIQIPLDPDAVVTHIELHRGNETLVGVVQEKHQARIQFDIAVARNEDAVLLESAGRGLLDLRFNLAPGSTATLNATWAQPVLLDQGVQTYEFPLTSLTKSIESIGVLRIRCLISTTHAWDSVVIEGLAIDLPENAGRRVAFDAGQESFRASQDLAIHLTPNEDALQSLLLLSGHGNDEAALFALRTTASGKPLPLDIVFILDRSGSMQGEKIEQARDGLEGILRQLRPDDRFALVSFDDDMMVYRQGMTTASPSEIARAAEWVQSIQPDGSTNIDGALSQALELLHAREGRSVPAIVLITDGQPTAGETNRDRIVANFRERNNVNARLHTVGIGFDREDGLLNSLAETNRGIYVSVDPEGDVRADLADFFRRIATPLYRDVRIELEGVPMTDVHPDPVPDAYADSHLLITGRINSTDLPQTLKARITAIGPDGPVTFEHVVDAARAPVLPEIDDLWARQKASALEHQLAIDGDPVTVAEATVELIRLGLSHQVATTLTSWVITQEPSIEEPQVELHDADYRIRVQNSQSTPPSSSPGGKSATATYAYASYNTGPGGSGGGSGGQATMTMASAPATIVQYGMMVGNSPSIPFNAPGAYDQSLLMRGDQGNLTVAGEGGAPPPEAATGPAQASAPPVSTLLVLAAMIVVAVVRKRSD